MAGSGGGFHDGDEEALAGGEGVAFGVLDGGLGPELAAFDAFDVAVEADRLSGGNGAQVFDLKLACEGDFATGAVGLAHGFVEEGGDDAAVEVTRRAFVLVAESGFGGDDAAVVGGEGEMEAYGVIGSAAEAAVALAVGERRNGMGGGFRLGGWVGGHHALSDYDRGARKSEPKQAAGAQKKSLSARNFLSEIDV